VSFALDARLEADTVALGDLALCRVLATKDARFPWLVLVPRRAGAVEIADLSPPDRAALIEETAAAATALKTETQADKINVGALGNLVAQLHVHVVARRRGDAVWPGPVWGSGPARPYERAALGAFTRAMARRLGLAPPA